MIYFKIYLYELMVLSEEERKRRKRECNKKYSQTEKGKATTKRKQLKEKEKFKNNEEYKEKKREKKREYEKTPARKKCKLKDAWKRKGLIMKHFEIIYLLYLTTTKCDICQCILTDGKPMKPTTKCLDHSHRTGLFRNILCHSCNVKRGEDNF